MKNSFGDSVCYTLFGESHGEAIGIVIDGLAPGIDVDNNQIEKLLSLRRPADANSTARREPDDFSVVSGVYNGKTTGTPICIIIKNTETKSKDYAALNGIARPGHADFTAFCKYHGFEDRRGGGHFSGRITAPIVAAGAIALNALKNKGIEIGTHISSIGSIKDRKFEKLQEDINALSEMNFPVLCSKAKEKMQEKIMKAKLDGDSVGGTLETVVTGVAAGVGEPWFDSVESKLSHALFSVPGIKGVSFGCGFEFAEMNGSQANDEFYENNGEIYTKTNNNGGINGGITNGMPIVFTCAVKPTPSISKKQNTVNFENSTNCEIEINGRHDPCIVHRAAIVVKCITALTICDLLATRFGTDYLA